MFVIGGHSDSSWRGVSATRTKYIFCLFVSLLLWVQCATSSSSTPLADTVKLGGTTNKHDSVIRKKKRRRRVRASDGSNSTAAASSIVDSVSHAAERKQKRRRKVKSKNSALPPTTNETISVKDANGKGKKKRTKASEQKKKEATPQSIESNNNVIKPAFVKRNATVTSSENATLLSRDSATSNTKHVEEHQVPITTAKKKKGKKAPTKSKNRVSSSSAIGGREAASLRRLKREWRDAVKLGVAYDWLEGKTVKQSTADSKNHDYVRIGPLGRRLLQWHFSVQGPAHSVYQNGVYHGRVLLPKDYPGSPPRVHLLTPSGRFIPGHDICLSASHYHPETWTPQWTVLSIVDALRIHMLTTANEIGGKEATNEEREKLALASRTWSLGGTINHERMVTEGIFPMKTEDTDQCEEPEVDTSEKKESIFDNDEVVRKCLAGLDNMTEDDLKRAIARSDPAAVRAMLTAMKEPDRRAVRGSLGSLIFHSLIEVLKSPTKLVLLALLTVFVILNT